MVAWILIRRNRAQRLAAAAAALRAVPDVSLTCRPLSEQVATSLIQERLLAAVSVFFGARRDRHVYTAELLGGRRAAVLHST